MQILDFTQDYILENDVVLLRPLKASDFENLVHFSSEKPNLWRYSLVPANSEERMKAYINKAIEAREQKSSYPFIVFDKRSQKYAGSTRFYDFQAFHNTTQLGYTWYGSAFQGTGLNKNCKFLLLQFAFDQLGLNRVEFRADNNNNRSIAAMKSIGCQVEGILRSNCKSEDGRRDSIVLSILKNEWNQSVKNSLSQKINSFN